MLWLRNLGLGSVLAAISVTPALAQDIALQPFPVDHAARVDSDADARFLLDGPAGKFGFIEVRDGHLYRGDGKRFRCWGVNLTGWTIGGEEIPNHKDAEVYAAALARLGVNCVRMHFLDKPDIARPRMNEGASRGPNAGPFTHTPRGLIRHDVDNSREFNPEQLERLDYWFNALKQRGIYVNFNLNVGREFKAGDGVPDADLLAPFKAFTYFGPELVALQKEYAKQLLGHLNPYTKLRYADDPAVMTVEVVNENSLLEFWMRNWLRGERVPGGKNSQLDMTPHYQALLVKLYNDWLGQHRKPDEVARLRQMAGVGTGQPVPLMRRGDHPEAPKLRFDAELEFITSVEIDFHAEMKRFLEDEVGVKAPIMPLNDHTYFVSNLPLMRTAMQADMLDAHVYWQHPAIYGRRNEPMVNSPELSIIQKLARSAAVGKAYTVSEVNHPYPSDYGSEMIPILASYAALQDWDAIYFYTFETKISGEVKPAIADHFDITLDPVKMAQMPAGAIIFLRGDVAAAKTTLTRSYSTEQINESARLPRADMPYFTPGFEMMIPLVHGSRVACLDCKSSLPAPLPAANPLVSDTGELRWQTDAGKDGIVSVDTPRSQALVGFVSANPGVQTRNLGAADVRNRFASITLSSLDGKPMHLSNRMLLTTTGKVENSGTKWDERRAMLTDWGTAPTVIEPITGWIQLKDLEGAVGVSAQPLDGAGRPIGKAIGGKMIEPGWEIAVGTPATTSYLVTVER
ncbi:hypothetical protein [Polymorphobacter fuscus]|uniref:Glycoside hydrolase family 42 N-terminal domain-containing protein n=1 Tax=Sandarakinorhabdus fusca TaxID=1439888 RepID=A0A7C9KM05_9SPHN|nr:hypothetical protein [Polymorphobacter fuscus]KAB7646283.1 hypothetical protein F9290_09540 [Polymorphobacter fuscus]MQT17503.1 hypothetical protein [Polymorphobacter fuscus]NJC09958.1 hypothetical protein [Polymorphobacter fuscus]